MYKMNYDLMQELNDKQSDIFITWVLMFRDQQPENQPYYDSKRCSWKYKLFWGKGYYVMFEDTELELDIAQFGKTPKEAYQKVNAHVRKLYRLNIK